MSPDPEIEQLIAIVLRALAKLDISAAPIRPADLPESREMLEQTLLAAGRSQAPATSDRYVA